MIVGGDQQMLDASCTSAEIKTANPSVAVFGIGAIAQHSGHLPLGTDRYQVAEVSRRVAEDLRAFLLPTLPFSMSECHTGTAGTVWLRAETLASIVRDVVHSLRSQGIHRVVLINGHGANFVLGPVTRELNRVHRDMMIILVQYEPWSKEAYLFRYGSVDSHAGEIETSLMLAIRPELVKKERVDGVCAMGREFYDYAPMHRWAPDGVDGIPNAASAEKGLVALDAGARTLAKEVRLAFEALSREDTGASPAESRG